MPDTTCPRCKGYRVVATGTAIPGLREIARCDLCGGTGQYDETDKLPQVVDSLMDALEADGLPVVRDE